MDLSFAFLYHVISSLQKSIFSYLIIGVFSSDDESELLCGLLFAKAAVHLDRLRRRDFTLQLAVRDHRQRVRTGLVLTIVFAPLRPDQVLLVLHVEVALPRVHLVEEARVLVASQHLLFERLVLFRGCRKVFPSLLNPRLEVVHVGGRVLRDGVAVTVVVRPRSHKAQERFHKFKLFLFLNEWKQRNIF